MSKHTISGHIYFEQDPAYRNSDWYKPKIGFAEGTEVWPDIWPNRAKVRDFEFEVEVPDDFDPTADQVSNLQKLRKDTLARQVVEIAAIDERINKLLALPMAVAVNVVDEDEYPF